MIGSRLGPWLLDSELGKGGMGCVYLARDNQGQRAAVKLLAAELTTSAGAVSRFLREISVLRKLDHPNIVRLFDSGEHQGRLYYVMEYIAGEDYFELLRRHTRLPWPEVLALALDISAALKHAHNQGVIHRDIKPSNLIRTPDGRVKLTDFGVAHVFSEEHITRPGAVVGTAEYLSPEQASGKPASPRSDLYSLGVVLYTLLTGRNPFVGPNIVDILHKHRYAQFDRPSKYVPDLPPDLDELVCQLMAKEPEKRPPDAGVLGRRLQAVQARTGRKSDATDPVVSTQPTHAGSATVMSEEEAAARRGEGEATLVSRFVRRELEAQNRGGPVRQFINRPAVLVTLFLACLGTLVWTFWPLGPDQLFARGAVLMTTDPEEAWERYFDKLESKYPDHPYGREVAEFRRQRDEQRANRGRARQGRFSEAQWFYQQGLRQRQQGDVAAARATWSNLVRAFRGVEAEEKWVQLAEKELAVTEPPKDEGRWAGVRAALDRAQELRREGKDQEAQEIVEALKELYRGDSSIRPILDEEREKAP